MGQAHRRPGEPGIQVAVRQGKLLFRAVPRGSRGDDPEEASTAQLLVRERFGTAAQRSTALRPLGGPTPQGAVRSALEGYRAPVESKRPPPDPQWLRDLRGWLAQKEPAAPVPEAPPRAFQDVPPLLQPLVRLLRLGR